MAKRRPRYVKPVVFIILLLTSMTFARTNVLAMSIEEAYQAIPHRRTLFNPKTATMSSEEKKFLTEFFHLVDLAIVERVEMLIWLKTVGERGRVATSYDQILNQLTNLTVPGRYMKEVKKLLIEAIILQRQFLEGWQNTASIKRPIIAADPRVRSASVKLQKAYYILTKVYPQENSRNKKAFFDYLCALDFI